MIKHSESAFFYPDKIKFRRIENSESYITNKLVLERMKETARKKLKLSLKSKKVKHNKEHSHWYSLDKLVNKKNYYKENRERDRVERGEGSHLPNFVCIHKIHFYCGNREIVRAGTSTSWFFEMSFALFITEKSSVPIFFKLGLSHSYGTFV